MRRLSGTIEMRRQLFTALVVLLLAQTSELAMHVKLKALKCYVDRPDFLTIEQCFVKAISRNVSTFNLIAEFLKILDAPFYFEVVVSYRYGTIYREIIKPPKFEWCSSVESLSSNVYLKSMYDLLKNSAPQLFQKCPWKTLTLLNVTYDTSKYPAPFPQGIYKATLNASKDVVGQFGWGYLILEVTSDLKYSF